MLNQLYEKINNFENKNTQGILETALLSEKNVTDREQASSPIHRYCYLTGAFYRPTHPATTIK